MNELVVNLVATAVLRDIDDALEAGVERRGMVARVDATLKECALALDSDSATNARLFRGEQVSLYLPEQFRNVMISLRNKSVNVEDVFHVASPYGYGEEDVDDVTRDFVVGLFAYATEREDALRPTLGPHASCPACMNLCVSALRLDWSAWFLHHFFKVARGPLRSLLDLSLTDRQNCCTVRQCVGGSVHVSLLRFVLSRASAPLPKLLAPRDVELLVHLVFVSGLDQEGKLLVLDSVPHDIVRADTVYVRAQLARCILEIGKVDSAGLVIFRGTRYRTRAAPIVADATIRSCAFAYAAALGSHLFVQTGARGRGGDRHA